MRLTPTVWAAIMLAGCAENPYVKFFRPASLSLLDEVRQNRMAPAPETPEVVHGNDPKADIPALLNQGYSVIGSSSYQGPHSSDQDAIKQAKMIGADRVVMFGKYARTVQSTIPITLPTSQTSVTNGSATAFGSGGSATAYGTASTTTYGTQTTFIPVSTDRYDYLAVYMVKVRRHLGVQYRNLKDEEAQQIGSVNGVVLTTVFRGSAAAAAGFLPGDIITAANGQAISEESAMHNAIAINAGHRVFISGFRAGKPLELPVTLN